MSSHENEVIESCGNVFADIGLPNPDEHLLKADIVIQLKRLIADRKLTQTKAASLIGIAQSDLSNVLGGHFRGYSVERLMRLMTAFDQDIEIRIRPRADTTRPAHISVTGFGVSV